MVWTGTAVIGECHHDYDPVFHTMFETAGMSFVPKNQGVSVQNKRHESTEPGTSISLSIYDLETLNCGFEMH
jgi:hypothetical protein